jgi:Tfp pilus assembly protein PilP
MTRWMLLTASSVLLFAGLGIVACEDATSESGYRDFGTQKSGPSSAADVARAREQQAAAKKSEADNGDTDAIELPPLTEALFVAGPRHRDPFAPFIEVLIKKEILTARPLQREVKLKEYDISELKLIGIITNIGDPRAMVTTPDNTGFVLRRGDYVGRADFVKQRTGGAPIQVNWRVARIHGAGKEEERGIYLVRDDPTSLRNDDVTRFIPLHPID